MTAPLTILQVPLKFAPAVGGVEQVVRQQCTLLAAAGHRVRVLTSDLDERQQRIAAPAAETIDGIPVARYRAWQPPMVKYPVFPGLLPPLFRAHCDLIHAHSFWYWNVAAAVARRRLRPGRCLVQPHFDPKQSLFHHAYRRLLGRALLDTDAVILVSRYEEQLLNRCGLHPRRRFLLPNAVDTGEFAGALPARPTLPGLPADRPLVLNVGRCSAGKGIDTLLNLAEQLRAARSDYFIVSAGPDAGGLSAYRHRIANAGLHDYCLLTGPLPRPVLIALYRNAAVYLHASRYEAFGIVIIEAMAAGLPVLAPDEGPMRELLSDGENGAIYPPGQVAAITRLLDNLARAPQLAARIGAAARQHVHAAYSLDAYRERLLAIYAAVMADPVGGTRS